MTFHRSGWLWVAAMVIACLAGVSRRLRLNATHPAPNIWDTAVPVQADLYLLAYLFIPIWILHLSVELPNRADETWLVRCGSRLRWLAVNGRWALGQATGLLLAWLVASLVLSAGLVWSSQWSRAAGANPAEDVLVGSLQTENVGPLIAWTLQWLAYLGLLLVLFAILAVATLVLARPWARYLSAGILYLVVVLVIRGGADFGGLLFVYAAAAYAQPVWLPVLAPAVVIAVIVGVFVTAEMFRRSPRLGSIERLGLPAAYLGVVIAGLVATAVNLEGELNAADLLLAAFYGFDANQLNAGVYAYFLLTFSGFTLVYLISVEQRLWPLYLLISIRSGSPRRWMLRAWRDIVTKVAALMLTLTAAAAVVVGISGHPLTGPELSLRTYQFAVNGALQLLVVTGVTLLIAYITRSRIAVVITIALIAVVQTPMINIRQTLPLGLNALGLVSDWSSAINTTMYLTVATAAAVGLSFAASSRLTRQSLERITA